MEESPTVQFKLNIPAGLKDRLSEAATRSGRSLTSEIITRLEASMSFSEAHGLDFTYEAFEAIIADFVNAATHDLEYRVEVLERHMRGEDPYNRDD